MTTASDERIERLENRVEKLEDKIAVNLQRIFEALEELKIANARSSCPSPGSCVSLGKELEHAITSHNATMLRVERIELKILEIDRMAVTGFHKIETQKAWILGAWSVVSFVAAILGACATFLIQHYLKK